MSTEIRRLLEFVKHKPGCASGWRASTGSSQIGPCDCGLDASIEALLSPPGVSPLPSTEEPPSNLYTPVEILQAGRKAEPPPTEATTEAPSRWTKNEVGDMVCEHGTAMDVHCCNCHSGFQFDADNCACGDLRAYGEAEAATALHAKDRDQYQFWQGWNAALERVQKPAAPPLVDPQPRTCQWAIDDVGGDSVYETQCGHVFEFTTDGPKENGIGFCGYCGGRLVEVRTSEDEEEPAGHPPTEAQKDETK